MKLGDGLFADESNFDIRFVPEYSKITQIVQALRTLGLSIVLTSGSFDLIHAGHSMYVERAREYGHFLIVGVDSDDKVRRRKGPSRPVVGEIERVRMLTHQRGVGLVTLKPVDEPKWALIKAVRPDVLVATRDTYSSQQIDDLESSFCGKVEVLEPMGDISTSARIRLLNLNLVDTLTEALQQELPGVVKSVIDRALRSGSGE